MFSPFDWPSTKCSDYNQQIFVVHRKLLFNPTFISCSVIKSFVISFQYFFLRVFEKTNKKENYGFELPKNPLLVLRIRVRTYSKPRQFQNATKFSKCFSNAMWSQTLFPSNCCLDFKTLKV